MREFIRKRFSLAITLVLFVFGVMMASFCVVTVISFIFHRLGILDRFSMIKENPLLPFLAILLICIFIGTAITAFFSKKALKPIRKVIDATHKVAQGDFNVKVDIKGVGELEDLSESFNKMTYELSSIETLRSDFVNNFSHEFKTPIVSIRGFAKLLKDGQLSEEEKNEYLEIIIAESERLAELSTNVLNLSKYENIEIITDKSCFRMDEQIRRAIVMTEPQWSAKEISMNVELEEVTFNGNPDLTQQIWINLLDNAVKFSYNGGMISVSLSGSEDEIRFTMQDEGSGMDEDTLARIFDKFYQGDESHAKAGNGLGLAIVKRITELCGGRIEVHSEPGKGSVFTVILPVLS